MQHRVGHLQALCFGSEPQCFAACAGQTHTVVDEHLAHQHLEPVEELLAASERAGVCLLYTSDAADE